MAQARSLHTAQSTRDPRRERSRNVRIGTALIVAFAALFVGSILYITLFPGAK